MDKKKQVLGVIFAAVGSMIFGFSFIAVKQSVNAVSAFTLLGWRFTIAFVVMSMLVLLGVFKVNFRGKQLKYVIAMGFFQPVVYFAGETFGIDMTTASESGTIMACIPLVTIGLSTLILKEPPTKLQLFSIIASVCGVIMIVLIKGLNTTFNPLGYGLLVIAMLGDSMFVMCARKSQEFTSVEKTYVMAAMGMVAFMSCALIENGVNGTLPEFFALPFTNMEFLSSLLYLSIVSQIVAFMMTNYSIAAIGANRTASFSGLSTVVSVVAGVLMLNEGFSLLQGVGTLLVLVGVYGANVMPKNAKPLDSIDDIKRLKSEQEKTDDTATEVK